MFVMDVLGFRYIQIIDFSVAIVIVDFIGQLMHTFKC